MGNGIAMWITVLFLASWLPMKWKLRLVGAGFYTDIAVHIILQSFFGGDAGGRAGMLFGGILINLSMHAFRWAFGYETLGLKGWSRFAGRFTPPEKVKPIKRTRTARSEFAESKQCR